ncbi:MAG: sugar phosphate isomerase/epimerase [Chlorobi bacterium]|nr:sugar phosphate isomerase/epimerase [Chlorobiota bacterium]
MKLFEKGCEIAKQVGAKGVLDNAPLPPYQFPEDVPVVRHYGEEEIGMAYFPDSLDWKKYWSTLTATYSECCDIAADYGLTFQMHPALGLLSSSADAFLYFYDAVGKENLRFNFDTANQFAMKENLALSLIRLAEFIDYIHISDNNGNRIEHLGIGKGKIRWDVLFDTLKKIKFNGYLGLDIGGDESAVVDLDSTYIHAAEFLEKQINK